MSKKYIESMNKVTVDEELKKKIILKLSTIEDNREKNAKEKSKENTKEKYSLLTFKGMKSMGIVAACCALVICTSLNNKLPNLLNKESLEINEQENEEVNEENICHDSKYKNEINNDSKTLDENNNKQDSIEFERNYNNKNVDKYEYKVAENLSTDSNKELSETISKGNEDNKNAVKSEKNLKPNELNNETCPKKENVESKDTKEKTNNISTISNNTEEKNTEDKLLDTCIGNNRLNSDIKEKNILTASEQFNMIDNVQDGVNFEVKIPQKLPNDLYIEDVSIISDKMIEVTYTNDKNNIVFTISKDMEFDIDKNYLVNKNIEIDNNIVNLMGNGMLFYTATWSIEDINYSMILTNGITKEDFLLIIMNIN